MEKLNTIMNPEKAKLVIAHLYELAKDRFLIDCNFVMEDCLTPREKELYNECLNILTDGGINE